MTDSDRSPPPGPLDRPGRTVRVPVVRWGSAAVRGPGPDEVVAEEPLEIRVAPEGQDRSDPVAITMRTPGHDFELAAGFALTEGIAARPEEIRGIRYCAPSGEEQQFNVVTVDLAASVPFELERFRRNTYATSSCGVCGRATLEQLCVAGLRPPAADKRFDPDRLSALPARLAAGQAVFARTGGLHATGAADANGNLRLVREDVGRHNAFDKVVGRLALDGQLPASGLVAVVSGRASFELVQKSIVAGFPALVAVGAPSHLAVALAREYRTTLVGFARADGFTVYSGAERLGLGSGDSDGPADRRTTGTARVPGGGPADRGGTSAPGGSSRTRAPARASDTA
jgi:FdhD protein